MLTTPATSTQDVVQQVGCASSTMDQQHGDKKNKPSWQGMQKKKAEFIALCTTTKAVVWLRRLLKDLNCSKIGPTTIFSDNQRAITVMNTPESVKRSKHIEVQYFYTCEKQRDKEIKVKYINTQNQLADTLTKPLTGVKFKNFRVQYGMY